LIAVFVGDCSVAPRYTRSSVSNKNYSSKSKFNGTTTVDRMPDRAGSFYQIGTASYYAKKFIGNKTANGERYNNSLTAAHRTLPFNTMVKVTNIANDRSVVVRINDRGPFTKKRIIDISELAAREIGLIRSGVGKVRLEVVK
jgi:rare lipoprotein A